MELVAMVNNDNKTKIAEKLQLWVVRVKIIKKSWKCGRKTDNCFKIVIWFDPESFIIGMCSNQLTNSNKLQNATRRKDSSDSIVSENGFLKTGTAFLTLFWYILYLISIYTYRYFTLEAEWPFLCFIRSSCPHTYWK